MIRIIQKDNLEYLKNCANSTFDLIYIDPPFNTGKIQKRVRKEKEYEKYKFEDNFENFQEFINPRLLGAYRVLKPNGSLLFHIDCREAHYCKILLDEIFGRNCFMNEIIWAYDYGGRSKSKWSCKHDTIFWYVKNPNNYTYNYDAIDRIPYLAPDLVGKEKAARGKTPTDVWNMTIVPTNSKEKTGYPTQKPEHLLRRLIAVHSNEGDLVLDFFAGSGTAGSVCKKLNRMCVLVDNNQDAIDIMKGRLKDE